MSSRSEARIGFWRGRGDGTFESTVAVAQLPDQPWQLFVADIDGDGRPDIVAQGNTNSGGGDSTIEVWLGGGPSNPGGSLRVYAPLPASGVGEQLLAVAPAPHRSAKGTFVLEDQGGALHLVSGACQ